MPGYSVCKIVGGKGGSNNTMKYVTLLFAGVALVVAMVAGMVIVRKRSRREWCFLNEGSLICPQGKSMIFARPF